MLIALKAMEAKLSYLHINGVAGLVEYIRLANAAIAKAEGRQ